MFGFILRSLGDRFLAQFFTRKTFLNFLPSSGSKSERAAIRPCIHRGSGWKMEGGWLSPPGPESFSNQPALENSCASACAQAARNGGRSVPLNVVYSGERPITNDQ
jgi:hypothetical protein